MSTNACYHERLLPRWWAWLLALSFVGMLAVAYGAALGATAGWLVGLGGGALVGLLLWVTAPRIEVTADHLTVDAARLPAACIGDVEALDADGIRRLRGPGGDARLFVALRPWSSPRGVIVQVDDPTDPHPAWLFTSRHPDRLVAALTGTMAH